MRAFSPPVLAALTLAATVSPAFLSLAFVSPAVGAPAAAHAPAAGVDSDLRCLLTMAVVGRDKTKQQLAQMGMVYFTGRISARAPGLDLPSAIKAEELKLAPKDLPAEAQRCGPMVMGAMRALQTSFTGPPGAAPAPAGATPAPSAAPKPAAPTSAYPTPVSPAPTAPTPK